MKRHQKLSLKHPFWTKLAEKWEKAYCEVPNTFLHPTGPKLSCFISTVRSEKEKPYKATHTKNLRCVHLIKTKNRSRKTRFLNLIAKRTLDSSRPSWSCRHTTKHPHDLSLMVLVYTYTQSSLLTQVLNSG